MDDVLVPVVSVSLFSCVCVRLLLIRLGVASSILSDGVCSHGRRSILNV